MITYLFCLFHLKWISRAIKIRIELDDIISYDILVLIRVAITLIIPSFTSIPECIVIVGITIYCLKLETKTMENLHLLFSSSFIFYKPLDLFQCLTSRVLTEMKIVVQ